MAAFGWFALGVLVTTAALLAVAHYQQRKAARRQCDVYDWLRQAWEVNNAQHARTAAAMEQIAAAINRRG